jgi:oxalate---CoA ligase
MAASREGTAAPIPATVTELISRGEDTAEAFSAPGRASLTFGELRVHLERIVAALNGLGVGRGDPVAIVLPNGPEMASAFVAIAAGATTAPLNPAYKAEEFEFYLGDLNARLLVVEAGNDTPARGAAERLGIAVAELRPEAGAGAGSFELVGDRTCDGPRAGGYAEAGDIALVLHTSGTTSRPKIVPLSQANVCASAVNVGKTLGLSPEDRCLNIMPLFHIHGLIAAVLSSLGAGASVFCTPGFDPAGFWAWMRESHPSWYTAVPTMHQMILDGAVAESETIRAARLRLIRSSSASLPPQTMKALEDAFGAPVVEAYGMTEAAHQMTCNPMPPRVRKPGSVGVAAGPEVAIMDARGELLPAGSAGEVVIRGPNVTSGYQGNPEANAAAFTGGWFRTGDEGVFDDEGYLRLTGRLKEVINRGGEKVMPREIDEALMDHPAVKQAVAFAAPHPTLGEDVAAAVVLREPGSATPQALRAFVLDRLAAFKVPSQVVIVDEIPKGPTGKLRRIGLAAQLAPALHPEYVAPRNSVEAALVEIWAEVIGAERVGMHDNFFALGGDSLRAARVTSRVQAAFGVAVTLDIMFRDPTLEAQALSIEEMVLSEVEAEDEDT